MAKRDGQRRQLSLRRPALEIRCPEAEVSKAASFMHDSRDGLIEYGSACEQALIQTWGDFPAVQS